jgi:hypothetical protein
MTENNIFDLLSEYVDETKDLEYMEDAVSNDNGEDESVSEYINSDIPSKKRRLDKIEEELSKFSPVLLFAYRDNEQALLDKKTLELEELIKRIPNSSYIGNQEPKEIRDLKSEIESCSVKIILLGKVLSKLGFDPKSPNQGSMTKRP